MPFILPFSVKQMLDSLPHSVLLMDQEGSVLYVNHHWKEGQPSPHSQPADEPAAIIVHPAPGKSNLLSLHKRFSSSHSQHSPGRLVPICASCKSIRNRNEEWITIEQYLKQQLSIQFTHDICLDCIRLLYPQYAGPWNR